jgi:hypothetical protein
MIIVGLQFVHISNWRKISVQRRKQFEAIRSQFKSISSGPPKIKLLFFHLGAHSYFSGLTFSNQLQKNHLNLTPISPETEASSPDAARQVAGLHSHQAQVQQLLRPPHVAVGPRALLPLVLATVALLVDAAMCPVMNRRLALLGRHARGSLASHRC